MSITTNVIARKQWPDLPFHQWEETYDTIHLWTQIVGKIKLEFAPFTNHWWHTAFSLSASGFTTGILPYKDLFFEIEFDFLTHQLEIKLNDGRTDYMPLKAGTIADFYQELKEKLKNLGIIIHIWTVPVEMEDRLPFDKDYRERKYDSEYATRHYKILAQICKVMQQFRSGFTGKASPVHFFWGSFDLAVTFFSGRPAPEHPGAPNIGKRVMQEAYCREEASFGFWAGKGLREPAFYAYTYPEPKDYKSFKIEPARAHYNESFREFILPYNAIAGNNSTNPEQDILSFFRSAFKAAEESGNWDKSLYATPQF